MIKELKWPKMTKPRGRKSRDKNSGIFIDWLVELLKSVGGQPPEGKVYNALCVYMSQKNVDWLSERIDPMVFLVYAPVVNPLLKDNEVEIDIEHIWSDKWER